MSDLLGKPAPEIELDDEMGRIPRPLTFNGSKHWRMSEIRAWMKAGRPRRAEWEWRGAKRTSRQKATQRWKSIQRSQNPAARDRLQRRIDEVLNLSGHGRQRRLCEWPLSFGPHKGRFLGWIASTTDGREYLKKIATGTRPEAPLIRAFLESIGEVIPEKPKRRRVPQPTLPL
jgi:hypothetical protein